jgi:hypothetical protein
VDGRKCYFEIPVNVTSVSNADGKQIWAAIIIDGKTRDEITPHAIPLSAGNHTVTVQKKGYTVSPVERVVKVEPTLLPPSAIPATFKLIKN